MSLEELLLKEDTLKLLTDNETINCENVEIILVELVEKLTEAQDRLESTKKRNLPKIEQIKKEKKEILNELANLKSELNELNMINPINLLEKRWNDFRTEGEYISKILNRNIREEFVNQMKRELKSFLDGLLSAPETIDQVTAQIHGCDELNERLDQKGIEGISISIKTEKLLSMLYKCHSEVFSKVYTKENEKEQFKYFCIDSIHNYFKKRIGSNVSNVASLPQFKALMLNDLSFTIVFIKIHYQNSANKLQILRSDYYSQFLKDQKDEIDILLQDIPNVKSVKKVSLFLSRLEKVLKPSMLRTDLVNFQFILSNYVQESAWKYLTRLNEIGEDELEGLTKFCVELLQLTSPIERCELFFTKKLEILAKIFNQSLVEIVNCYHRKEYCDLKNSELKGFIEAIFAHSPLRNEFIREIEIDAEYFDDNKQEEEYF